MRVPSVLGESGRYQVEGEVGRGGMGAVYKAVDRNTGQYVAIKVMLDASNPEVLALFDKEWRILAELQQTNIIGISDRGHFQDGPHRYPYFVMPFLRGQTLQERIAQAGPLPTAEVARIAAAASAGLQAAHVRGVIHRDVKPSNIFILESGSIVVIDFGIVHFGDSRNQTTRKGTTPYIAPELLDPRKRDIPSPQSDLFSLGVVCYEALTGVQPFARQSPNDTIRAVLKEIPKPAYELNRSVSLGVGQVVQKATAKDKSHRYKSVIEFAEQFQRASRGETLPEFDRHFIEGRLRVVREAISKGQATAANDVLRGLEEEGYVDPSITAQREKIDQMLQRSWISTQLESVRLCREAKDYESALEKLWEVLEADPDHAEALVERALISQERLSDALDGARKHMQNREFAQARECIEQARQIDAQDADTSELLSELSRIEEAERALTAQKEVLYQEAQTANRNGYVHAALRRMEKLMELLRNGSPSSQPERDAIYIRFHEEVLGEFDREVKACNQADRLMAEGKFSEAADLCDSVLMANTENHVFRTLKLEAQRRESEQRLESIRELADQLRAAADLDERVAMAQKAMTLYPDDSHVASMLRYARESRDLILSLIAQARAAEDNGEFSEALNRWRSVERQHPAQPGLALELRRVEKRIEEQDRASNKATLTDEIWRLLRAADYQQAAAVCDTALRAFQGDRDLMELQSEARQRISRAVEVKFLIAEGRSFLNDRNVEGAERSLRHACELDRNDPEARQFLGMALLAKAQLILESDLSGAEKLLAESRELIPNDPAVKFLAQLVTDRKQRESVDLSLTKARRLVLQGQLREAVAEIDSVLVEYSNDRRLLAERAKVLQDLGEHIATPTPRTKSPTPRTPIEEDQPASPPEDIPLQPVLPSVAETNESGTVAEPVPAVAPAASENPENRPTEPPAGTGWTPLRESPAGAASRTGGTVRKLAWLSGAGRLIRDRRVLAAVVILIGLPAIWVAYAIVGKPKPGPIDLVGHIQIVSTPGAELKVDGKVIGVSPASAGLTRGSHVLTASLRGYTTRQERIKGDGKSKTIDFELQPVLLALRVVSDRSKGSVWLDENKVAELNGAGVDLPPVSPGAHSLKLDTTPSVLVQFQYNPGELPRVLDLPTGTQPVILAMAGFDGKMHAQTNDTAAKLSSGSDVIPITSGGGDIEVTKADDEIQLETPILKKRPVTALPARDSPVLTVALFWGGTVQPPVASRRTSSADEELQQARSLIDDRRYSEADALVDDVRRKQPANPEAAELKRELDGINKDVYPFRKKLELP